MKMAMPMSCWLTVHYAKNILLYISLIHFVGETCRLKGKNAMNLSEYFFGMRSPLIKIASREPKSLNIHALRSVEFIDRNMRVFLYGVYKYVIPSRERLRKIISG